MAQKIKAHTPEYWEKRNTPEFKAKNNERHRKRYAEKKAAGLIVIKENPAKRGRKKGFKFNKPEDLLPLKPVKFFPIENKIDLPVQTKPLKVEKIHETSRKWNPKYSEKEIQIIKDKYYFHSDEYIGKLINRKPYAVMIMRYKLGLKKPKTLVTIINEAKKEVIRMRKLFAIVQDMKALVIMAEIETNSYKRDIIKSQLLKLSNEAFMRYK